MELQYIFVHSSTATPLTNLQFEPLDRRDETVLAGVLHVVRIDEHPPRWDGWHGRAEVCFVIAVFWKREEWRVPTLTTLYRERFG